MSLPVFDNHDPRIRYFELLLECSAPFDFPDLPLPEGYHFVSYAPGDREAWLTIEQSAKEFPTREEGLAAWGRYYAGHEADLPGRMLFIANAAGEKVATATAYFDPRDREGAGWLHWVAVRREDQGRGLARPLIAHALRRLAELGYAKLKIPTQTTTWVAARLYLEFGFRPIPANALHSRVGWSILRRLTDHPALADFPPAADHEVLVNSLVKLRERADLAAPAADWFNAMWGVPRSAYEDSIAACLERSGPVPQWYLALEGDRIVGGLGVIDNDFHPRRDLAPNVCAVFTLEDRRGLGVARDLLELCCRDMAALGVPTLYLVTDHVGFYERYGWQYLCPVTSDGETTPSRLLVHREN